MKSNNVDNLSKEEVVELLKETEQKLLQATQNLGHPSYEYSYSTREAIDQLREECFDFLEIPKETA